MQEFTNSVDQNLLLPKKMAVFQLVIKKNYYCIQKYARQSEKSNQKQNKKLSRFVTCALSLALQRFSYGAATNTEA
jgi:hypothetical protein